MKLAQVGNIVLLIAAAAVGAKVMWYVDDQAFRHQSDLVFTQLAKDARPTTVDVHKIGLHGDFTNIQHDPYCGDVPSDEEKQELAIADPKGRELFATPGGAYTQADIDQNGTVQPFERFHDYVRSFNISPKPGRPIDPVLGTFPSGGLTWIVGGKRYSFAAISSLEEFVMRAKRDPKSIRPPEEFIAPAKG